MKLPKNAKNVTKVNGSFIQFEHKSFLQQLLHLEPKGICFWSTQDGENKLKGTCN